MRLISVLLCLISIAQAGELKPINQSVLSELQPKYLGHITPGLSQIAEQSKSQGELMQVQFNPYFQTPNFIAGELTAPANKDLAVVAKEFVQRERSTLKIADLLEMRLLADSRDHLGMAHVKFRPYLDGIEVWPAELIVHVRRDGVVTTVNGNYRGSVEVPIEPSISAVNAEAITELELASSFALNKTTTLLVYDWMVEEPRLAYRVNVHSDENPMIHEDVFVDAHSGVILNRINQICTARPSFKEAVSCTVFPNRTDNQSATVSGWRDNNQIFLVNTSKPMFPGQLDPNTLAGTIYLLECLHTNQPQGFSIDPNADATFNDNDDSKAAGAAAYNMSRTYDWLLATFNRNSYDGNGSPLRMFVNFRSDPSQGLDNAFWNGRELVFGDGGMISYNWAFSLDFMTHEICHAITSSSADLVYQFQSGALNESFSDMYAATQDDSNWLLGETIIKQETYISPGLRDLSNPHQQVQTGDFNHGWQPAHMNEFQNLAANQDNGGVHINSGITNFAYYKLATNIGRAKAIQIMHRTLTMYLSKNSQFTDCRAAAERAATDIHGQGSAELQAVSNAFAEVGIGAGAPPPPPGTGSSTLYYPFVAPFDFYNLSYAGLFTVSNVTDSSQNGTVTYFDTNGNQAFVENFTIGPHQTLYGQADNATQWLKIESTGSIIGSYQHMTSDGSAWSMIPATSTISNGMFVPHIATNTQKFWTVGAVANIRDTPSSIIFVDNLDSGWTVGINQVGQAAAFDFESALYNGSYPDTSAQGGLWGFFLNYDLDGGKVLEHNIAGAEIFGRKDANQIAGLITDTSSGRAVLFTHVAANTQLFWTGYSVINLTDQNANVAVTAYDNNGAQLANNVVSIPAFGKLLRVTGDALVPPGTSWFIVSGLSETTVLAGMELFGSLDDRQLAGFQATPLVGKKFYFPFVISGSANRPTNFDGLVANWTGISVVNPNAGSANLTIRVYRSDGALAQGTTTLASNNKLLNTINGLMGITDFYGYVEIEATESVAGFSLSGFDNQQELAGNPMVFVE